MHLKLKTHVEPIGQNPFDNLARIDPREIVEWILADRLDVRFQLQMHKFIWTPTQRGV